MSRGRKVHSKNPTGTPGQRLEALRNGLGITSRDVELLSRRIAQVHGDMRYYISHASLDAIENDSTLPGVYKFYTLSALYQINFVDLLLLYGIDLDQLNTARLAIKLPKTHLVPTEIYDRERRVRFPARFDPGARIEETNLLSRMVQTWGEIPIAGIQSLALRKCLYGFIGVDDYTLYPMIRPGTFVQIDDQDTQIEPELGANEFERPIYFFELRDGYAYGWCRLEGNVLTIVPHSLSPAESRDFIYPGDIDVLGKVVAVAMSLRQKPGRQSLPRPARKRTQ